MLARPVAAASRSVSEPSRASEFTPLYFDNLATTPVDPRVLESMLPYYTEHFGNASSKSHSYGWSAAAAVDLARRQVAELFGASEREIVFTSGATEANNLALKGAASAYGDVGDRGDRRVITCVTEHPAVLDCCASLESQGFEVVRIAVDGYGRINLEELRSALDGGAMLVSVMAANNEIGTTQPIREIAELASEKGALVHCDAAQAAGKLPLDVKALGVDLMSISAHKMYGPKGQGALFVRGRNPRVRLRPQIEGGGQERALRSGTLNVPGIVGLGAACALAREEMEAEALRLRGLRDYLHEGFAQRLQDVHLNGHPEHRLPGCLNVRLGEADGAQLLIGLRDHVALSSGSACASGTSEPSHVLRAIGATDAEAFASVRFGLGRFTTRSEVDSAIERVVAEAARQHSVQEVEQIGN